MGSNRKGIILTEDALQHVLAHPSTLLWKQLRSEGIEFTARGKEAYALGKLAACLELETIARLSEEMSAINLNDALNLQIASAVRASQSALLNADLIASTYDRLSDYAAAASGARLPSSDASSLARIAPRLRGTEQQPPAGRSQGHDA